MKRIVLRDSIGKRSDPVEMGDCEEQRVEIEGRDGYNNKIAKNVHRKSKHTFHLSPLSSHIWVSENWISSIWRSFVTPRTDWHGKTN